MVISGAGPLAPEKDFVIPCAAAARARTRASVGGCALICALLESVLIMPHGNG